MAVVRASHVYKVFGRNGREVVERLEAGSSRDELRRLGTAAVIDASFEVEKGESFVVMGLSGSGKSTLIRMINGLWAPTSGTVEVAGEDISHMPAARLRKLRAENIAMVFQHFALLPHRTVRENAAYALEIKQVPTSQRLERADHWLEVVGLDGWGDKYPGQLSGGMQQRVGLARALAAETDILLMDEAFSALDPLIRREMQDQLVELQSTLNKTIVFITHDLNEAMYLGDRIAVMRDGRIVQIGTAEDILTNPVDDYVASFVQDVDRTRVLTASSIMQKPRAVVTDTAGPRMAIRVMEDTKASGLLVTSRDRRLLGQVSDRSAVAAAREGVTDLRSVYTTENVLTVRPDTPMSELFAQSSSSPVPLAVIDEQDRLVGVIPRIALLNSMASVSPTTGELPITRLSDTIDEKGV
ncbi:quaternary amine ABC transporter ATP-binding protein [Brevibacterium ihuae]|uniref:quaternary amine ABC transporter ATP-binding protein n=1 Tax=Brevibacterium ihuae TaxID=1631743 RepID=UPI000C78F371|nr:glycine betaine/L-proline ABC transporter ATP-binding protein [Brevibacterium ihuae]